MENGILISYRKKLCPLKLHQGPGYLEVTLVVFVANVSELLATNRCEYFNHSVMPSHFQNGFLPNFGVGHVHVMPA